MQCPTLEEYLKMVDYSTFVQRYLDPFLSTKTDLDRNWRFVSNGGKVNGNKIPYCKVRVTLRVHGESSDILILIP